MATRVNALTAEQIDVLLASHVTERHAWQATIVTGLQAIDDRTRRIDQLLQQRARIS